MRSTGRPKVKPIKLMDGFYVEVFNKGSNTGGLKIRSETKEAMELNARLYASSKNVNVLGEFRDGVRLSKETA